MAATASLSADSCIKDAPCGKHRRNAISVFAKANGLPPPGSRVSLQRLSWSPASIVATPRAAVFNRRQQTDPGGYEYPFPDAANQDFYTRYRERADEIAGLVLCGRLGEYRYYHMNQAIGRALTLAKRLVSVN